MFSGIVEITAKVTGAKAVGDLVRLVIGRPQAFDDLKTGDSISTDGVCLTLEEYTPSEMRFALGPETLKVTGWTTERVLGRAVNLERSIRLQDRIHGHLVTGHVDCTGVIRQLERTVESLTMSIEFPQAFMPLIWPKGSVAINGVSLTVNQVNGQVFTVGLIPETLKRTNLGEIKIAETVNLEFDNMARGLVNWARLSGRS